MIIFVKSQGLYLPLNSNYIKILLNLNSTKDERKVRKAGNVLCFL